MWLQRFIRGRKCNPLRLPPPTQWRHCCGVGRCALHTTRVPESFGGFVYFRRFCVTRTRTYTPRGDCCRRHNIYSCEIRFISAPYRFRVAYVSTHKPTRMSNGYNLMDVYIIECSVFVQRGRFVRYIERVLKATLYILLN